MLAVTPIYAILYYLVHSCCHSGVLSTLMSNLCLSFFYLHLHSCRQTIPGLWWLIWFVFMCLHTRNHMITRKCTATQSSITWIHRSICFLHSCGCAVNHRGVRPPLDVRFNALFMLSLLPCLTMLALIRVAAKHSAFPRTWLWSSSYLSQLWISRMDCCVAFVRSFVNSHFLFSVWRDRRQRHCSSFQSEPAFPRGWLTLVSGHDILCRHIFASQTLIMVALCFM